MFSPMYMYTLSSFHPLTLITLCTSCTAAIVSLASFKYQQLASLRKLSVLWTSLFLLDITGNYMREVGIENHWLYNLYDWILYLGLAFLFYQQLLNHVLKTIIKIFMVVFPLFVVIDSLYIETIYEMQSLVIVFGGNFIIFTSAAYLHQLYSSDVTQRVTSDPWFWFSIGFIIYMGAAIPYLGLLNQIFTRYPHFASWYYFYVYMSFTALLHLFMLKGFLCRIAFRK